MPHTIAKELKDAGFPNIQDVQHRQGREFVTPDGTVSVYSVGEIAPAEEPRVSSGAEVKNYDEGACLRKIRGLASS